MRLSSLRWHLSLSLKQAGSDGYWPWTNVNNSGYRSEIMFSYNWSSMLWNILISTLFVDHKHKYFILTCWQYQDTATLSSLVLSAEKIPKTHQDKIEFSYITEFTSAANNFWSSVDLQISDLSVENIFIPEIFHSWLKKLLKTNLWIV